MRVLALLLLLPLASPGATLSLPALPAPVHADAESSTNVPFSFGGAGRRVFTLSLSLSATSSNCVEVAFGRDADMDGELSDREAALAVGWDCGSWIVSRPSAGAEVSAPAATAARSKTLSWFLRLDRSSAPAALRADENGRAVAACREELGGSSWTIGGEPPCGSADVGLADLFDPSWDTARVTARGADAPSASVFACVSASPFVLFAR